MLQNETIDISSTESRIKHAQTPSTSRATGAVRRKTIVRDPVLTEIGTTREEQQTSKCRKLYAKAKHFCRNMRLMRQYWTSWFLNFYEDKLS
ncbi:hypothetical protein Trydic_g11547 [Trypoxylus dichotomus]